MTAAEDLDVGDDWADLTTPTDERVVEVARAHGTVAAADWSGWSRHRVVELRKRLDGYDRGRGHPTVEEIAARRPRHDCPCTMCVVWRWDEEARLQRIEASLPGGGLVDLDASWMTNAACSGQSTDVWFPVDDQGRRAGTREDWRYQPGQMICAACTVRAECKAYALVNGIDDGMWGGETPWERTGLTLGGRIFKKTGGDQ